MEDNIINTVAGFACYYQRDINDYMGQCILAGV
jgi:hypothetical protein